MTVRQSEAIWRGALREGDGIVKLGSGAFEGSYTWASRFDVGEGTNPEELIAAAHAGCFSMFLSALLTKAGFPPTQIQTIAAVHLEAGPAITKIELSTQASVPGLDEATFLNFANEAKEKCPVSKALASVPIALNAQLIE